jgi:hypothetical protein
LQKAAESIGLLGIIQEAMPALWTEIFALSCYLVASDKPVMYCEDWASDNEGIDVGSMASQRISELLEAFGCAERNAFYGAWYKHIREREYIALDITSVSSYSKRISEMEWVYNRDGEDLPQANICMLFGEQSKLPVYQALYSGSLNDVTTLKATLAEFKAIVGTDDIMLAMDKGFFSAANVNMLLGGGEGAYKFLLPIPFTCKFAKSQADSERKDIDQISNVILTSSTPIRGIHKVRTWGVEGKKLHTHVYYDPEKATVRRNELYGHVAALKNEALKDPANPKLQREYKRYLIVRKSGKADGGVTVNIREGVVAKKLETAGWFVLISNHIEDAQAAHDIYRIKDVVEKAFLKYKNSLGIDRFRVHNSERMHNKTFAAFIALILASHIYNVMKEKQLHKRMTFDSLLITLSKLKIAAVGETKVLRPLTKEQNEIFEAFDIPKPVLEPSEQKQTPKKRGRKKSE